MSDDGSSQIQTPTTTEPITTTETTATTSPPATTASPESVLSGASEEAASANAFDPEKLTLPEGFDRTEANAPYTSFVSMAKEIGLSAGQAQKLVDFHLEHTKAASAALENQWTQTQDGWISEVKADKEIGNIDTLRRTIGKLTSNAEFTDPKFEEALALTGAGNHPAVLRTLFRWAKALGEGKPTQGTPPPVQANGQSRPVTAAEAIYGPNGPASGGPNLART